MFDFNKPTNRRVALGALGGAALAAVTLEAFPALANAASSPLPSSLPQGGDRLAALMKRLMEVPRRRDFVSVPFMVDRIDLWDYEASSILLAYTGGPRQVWESTEIAAPWPNLMREALNGQVFAHQHPDFLGVAAVHGNAHLSLFNQEIWDKYSLSRSTAGKFQRNDLIVEKGGVSPEDSRQDVNGFYGPGNNNIVSLQRRGMVFVACHDSIHAIARGLAASQPGLKSDAVAADLTNSLIPGAILVPSVVAYLVELQDAKFTYAKAG